MDAIFYSDAISLVWLGGAAVALLAVVALRRLGVTRIAVYGLVGLIAWVATFRAIELDRSLGWGVQSTVSGSAASTT